MTNLSAAEQRQLELEADKLLADAGFDVNGQPIGNRSRSIRACSGGLPTGGKRR